MKMAAEKKNQANLRTAGPERQSGCPEGSKKWGQVQHGA